MGFESGTMSFRRFAVMGEAPAQIEQSHLDRLAELAMQEQELGVPEEDAYGWCGGRHILDAQFSFDRNVYNDSLFFALRIDTNKVPASIKQAYIAMEEEAAAAGNPSGFISRQQKKDVRELVRSRLDDELRSGRYRRSKMVPILWDLATGELRTAAGGKSLEMLHEIFERTFGLSLLPLSAGSSALRLLEPQGRRRDYEDAKPTRFVYGPEGEGVWPEYPWVLKGPEPKDFFGNEFLLWLWQQADLRDGAIMTEDAGEVTILIDKSLDLDCAYAQTGRDSLRGDGPTQMPEARHALRTGKLPRKAGMLLHAFGQQYEFRLNVEEFSFGALRLPEVEDADTPRVLFEERITLLRDFERAWDALYDTFLKVRCSSSWEGQTSQIRKWITAQTAPRPARELVEA